MLPKLIGICGYKGSGKDTAHLYLASKFPFERYAMADPLRDKLRPLLLGLHPIPDDVPAELRSLILEHAGENISRQSASLPPILFEKPYSDRVRILQQLWGTEYRRNMHGEDYWLKRHRAHLGARPNENFTATDIRFVNEGFYVRRRGGVVWRILNNRVDHRRCTHSSELEIPDVQPHLWVENHGTLDEFHANLDRALLETSVMLDGRGMVQAHLSYA